MSSGNIGYSACRVKKSINDVFTIDIHEESFFFRKKTINNTNKVQ